MAPCQADPRTVTETRRCLALSSSTKKILCQLPSCSFPSASERVSEVLKRVALQCE